MELQTERLDELVASYLSACSTAATPAEEELRQLLLGGAFAVAATRLAALSPSLADSQWLQFQLKKHQFMHVARAAGSADSSAGEGDGGKEAQSRHLAEALDLARRELAPLALHAYAEAYSDFKHCMVALVAGFGGEGAASSSGGDRGDAELQEFAGMVVRAVRQETGSAAAAPRLSQLLRYLLLLHQHQHHSGFHPYWWPSVTPHTQQLCAALLLPTCDAPPPPALMESCQGFSACSVREQDVQALRTSLGCDREQAVALLRRAKGSALNGLQDALQAAHINEVLLHELAEDYAACRGLELSPATPAAAAAAAVAAPPTDAGAGAGAGANAKQVDEQQQTQHAPQQAQQQTQQQQEADQQPPQALCKALGAGKAGGDGGQAAAASGGAAAGGAEAEAGGGDGGAGAALELPAELTEQQLRQLMRRLEQLLAGGRADKALEQLQAADPAFLPDHPSAAFALHRCAFLQLLLPQDGSSTSGGGDGGATAAALAYVRQHLAPLAQQHPDLLQAQLKSALALLLPLPAGGGGGAGAAAAAAAQQQQRQQQQGVADALSALRAALHPRCLVREPRLLALLRELLGLHAAHFKLQRCQDKFAADLGITALKATTVAATTAPNSGSGASAVPVGAGAAAAAAAAVAAAVAEEARQALAAAAAGLPRGGGGGGQVPVPGVRIISSDSDEEDDAMQEDSDEEEGGGRGGILGRGRGGRGGAPPGLEDHPDEDEDEEEEEEGEGEEDEELGVPEQAILTVCEFTGLPRHAAIELLLVHGGDAAAVLAHIFP